MSLITGLQAYYAFSSGAFLTDSANANNLTNNNSATQVSGLIGDAANYVQASDQFFSVANNATLDYTTAFSVSTWILPTNPLNFFPFAKGSYTGGTAEWSIQCLAGVHYIDVGNAYTTYNNAPSLLSSSVWNHLVMVYDGSQPTPATRLTYWINNVQQTLTMGAIPTSNTPQSGALFIGQFDYSGRSSDGKQDETGFWNRPLTSAEIGQLYNSGTGLAYPFSNIYTLTVSDGIFSLTGENNTFDRGMSATFGNYNLTGENNTFDRGMSATFGNYNLTGENNTFGLGMPATFGNYILTGENTNLTVGLPSTYGGIFRLIDSGLLWQPTDSGLIFTSEP